MDSKNKFLIEKKVTFWKKIIKAIKSFFKCNFFNNENKVEEISEGSLNNITAEIIENLSYNQNEEDTKEIKKELFSREKLEELIKENQELEMELNNRIEELKKIRVKELKTTLQIYQIEELVLKKIIENKKIELNNNK